MKQRKAFWEQTKRSKSKETVAIDTLIASSKGDLN